MQMSMSVRCLFYYLSVRGVQYRVNLPSKYICVETGFWMFGIEKSKADREAKAFGIFCCCPFLDNPVVYVYIFDQCKSETASDHVI